MWGFRKLRYQQQARVVSLRRFGAPLAVVSGTCWLLSSKNDDGHNNHHNNRPKQFRSAERSSSAVVAAPPIFVSSCESSSILLSPPAPPATARLRRQATMKRLHDTAADDRLERLYDIDWRDEPLGEGTFGAVFVGTHRETGTPVAIKKIPKKFTSSATFQREMDAMMQIKAAGGHSSICWMREHFDQGQFFYLILDLIQGGELFEHLSETGSYSEAKCARILRDLASALHFLHGIGIVHCDVKPENLILSSRQPEEASVKLVDFGCAHFTANAPFLDHEHKGTGMTVAYCPPEVLRQMKTATTTKHHADIDPSFDMWSLGIVMYIMLTGAHPFDLDCRGTNEEIEAKILSGEKPPIRNSEYTAHLSKDAIDLLDGLIEWDPNKRLTAEQLLQHRWILGETATTKKISGSEKRLTAYRKHKTEVGKSVFKGLLSQSVKHGGSDTAKRTGILEMAFQEFDTHHRSSIDPTTRSASSPLDKGNENRLSLSDVTDLLAEHMTSRFFSKGKTVYKEGSKGTAMYFLQSGQVEVASADGFRTVRQAGEFFGEEIGTSNRRHLHSVTCLTPVHLLEISREYFDKYMEADVDVQLTMAETNRLRKRERAKILLGLQENMIPVEFKQGETIFREGGMGNTLFVLDKNGGNVNISVGGNMLRSLRPGEMTGEHAAFYQHKAYNVTAECASENCKMLALEGKYIQDLCRKNKDFYDSFRDILLRRDFKKALVSASKRPFPDNEEDLRAAFKDIDTDNSGDIHFDNIRDLIKNWDPTCDDNDIRDMLKSHDLNRSGTLTWNEFKRIFGMVNES